MSNTIDFLQMIDVPAFIENSGDISPLLSTWFFNGFVKIFESQKGTYLDFEGYFTLDYCDQANPQIQVDAESKLVIESL